MSTNTQDYKNIEGAMIGLMRELAKLAPHPDHPDHKGPLFVQVESQYAPAAEYDGMLGSLMMETMLGTAFSGAASGSGSLGWDDMADAASTYIEDRASKNNSNNNSNNNFQLGTRSAIARGFNRRAGNDPEMNAYLADLPRRMGLERWLAQYQRKLYAMRKDAALRGLKFAA